MKYCRLVHNVFTRLFGMRWMYYLFKNIYYCSFPGYPMSRIVRLSPKYLCNKRDDYYHKRRSNYCEKLEIIGFRTVAYIFANLTVIFLCKLTHNLIDYPGLLYQLTILIPRQNSRQNITFYRLEPTFQNCFRLQGSHKCLVFCMTAYL